MRREFHFGTLSLTADPARSATQKAVAYAKEKGKIISFDPNLCKPLWNDLEEAKRQMLWGLAQADIVKISDEEVEFLWGISPEEGARKLHDEFGVTLAFVTLGPKGCFYSNGRETGTVDTPAGIRAIDTTGAGDIFGGSVLSRIFQSGKPIAEISGEALEKMTRFACWAAAKLNMLEGRCTCEGMPADVKNISLGAYEVKYLLKEK